MYEKNLGRSGRISTNNNEHSKSINKKSSHASTSFQMVAIQATMVNKSKHKIELNRLDKLDIDGHNVKKQHTEIINEQLNTFLSPDLKKPKAKLNASFIDKLIIHRRRNLFIKDKKSAHFLFILVFTFFICWVRLNA